MAKGMGDQRCLLRLVPFHQAGCGRSAGLAASIACTCRADLGLRKAFLDQRFDKEPCAVILRLFLRPDDFFEVHHTLQADDQRFTREGVKLLKPDDRGILVTGRVACFHQVIRNLARTEDEALHILVCRSPWIRKDAHKVAFAKEILGFRNRHFVTQKRFWRHDDERLAEGAVHLATQQVEEIGRGRAIGDLDIVFGAQLQEALKPRRAMLGPLPFETVRQQHHKAVGAKPFGFAARDELVDDGLRAVDEVAKLAFPHHQCFRIGAGKAIFIAEHAEFGERAVIDLKPAMRHGR